ncbi:hypothetical protein FB475_4760 [Kribbella jejuensis]|uniref:Uncharacterized protein n=1 Tax=Kribbella jejuensis TaxID=236068 RepID=A0A542E941_9ACTN|nr:hypothetical protein FB475_4760 [Kribbella jejuensis]
MASSAVCTSRLDSDGFSPPASSTVTPSVDGRPAYSAGPQTPVAPPTPHAANHRPTRRPRRKRPRSPRSARTPTRAPRPPRPHQEPSGPGRPVHRSDHRADPRAPPNPLDDPAQHLQIAVARPVHIAPVQRHLGAEHGKEGLGFPPKPTQPPNQIPLVIGDHPTKCSSPRTSPDFTSAVCAGSRSTGQDFLAAEPVQEQLASSVVPVRQHPRTRRGDRRRRRRAGEDLASQLGCFEPAS